MRVLLEKEKRLEKLKDSTQCYGLQPTNWSCNFYF